MMKKNIVIHVGLPKTATTYIQKLMSNKRNYLGLESPNAEYTTTLLKIFSKFIKCKDVHGDISQWSSRLLDLSKNERIDSPIVLSSEFFFAGELNRVPEFPLILERESESGLLIADFLKLLSDILLEKAVRLDVLLTIRNQPEWLASKYAQASPKVIGASQKDFEERVKKFSKLPSREWCDWSLLIKRLDDAIGKEHVNVLCMEEMGKREFWQQLSSMFLGSGDESLQEQVASEQTIVNQKRGDANTWRLGKFQLGAYAAKRYRLVPGSAIHSYVLKAGNVLGLLGPNRGWNRDGKIIITDDVLRRCQDACGEGNSWLQERLNKDLTLLGYPTTHEFLGRG